MTSQIVVVTTLPAALAYLTQKCLINGADRWSDPATSPQGGNNANERMGRESKSEKDVEEERKRN